MLQEQRAMVDVLHKELKQISKEAMPTGQDTVSLQGQTGPMTVQRDKGSDAPDTKRSLVKKKK